MSKLPEMNIFFFTYVDDNPKYRQEAEYLIKSGAKFGRKIHLYEIPEGEMWNRYKVKLLARTDLPKADRYVCLDSDTVLTCKGDWEAPDCQGMMDILYFTPATRDKHTVAFIRNHTLLDDDPGGYEYILDLWRKSYCPYWPNSGVVVLDDHIRLDFAACWQKWMEHIDSHCDKGYVVGDEGPATFAIAEYGLPWLPPRFNGCCKWQPIHPWHVLIHADGSVTGDLRKPYNKAVEAILK
jgi:hypothetical protein